jgi:hypothetical protein
MERRAAESMIVVQTLDAMLRGHACGAWLKLRSGKEISVRSGNTTTGITYASSGELSDPRRTVEVALREEHEIPEELYEFYEGGTEPAVLEKVPWGLLAKVVASHGGIHMQDESSDEGGSSDGGPSKKVHATGGHNTTRADALPNATQAATSNLIPNSKTPRHAIQTEAATGAGATKNALDNKTTFNENHDGDTNDGRTGRAEHLGVTMVTIRLPAHPGTPCDDQQLTCKHRELDNGDSIHSTMEDLAYNRGQFVNTHNINKTWQMQAHLMAGVPPQTSAGLRQAAWRLGAEQTERSDKTVVNLHANLLEECTRLGLTGMVNLELNYPQADVRVSSTEFGMSYRTWFIPERTLGMVLHDFTFRMKIQVEGLGMIRHRPGEIDKHMDLTRTMEQVDVQAGDDLRITMLLTGGGPETVLSISKDNLPKLAPETRDPQQIEFGGENVIPGEGRMPVRKPNTVMGAVVLRSLMLELGAKGYPRLTLGMSSTSVNAALDAVTAAVTTDEVIAARTLAVGSIGQPTTEHVEMAIYLTMTGELNACPYLHKELKNTMGGRLSLRAGYDKMVEPSQQKPRTEEIVTLVRTIVFNGRDPVAAVTEEVTYANLDRALAATTEVMRTGTSQPTAVWKAVEANDGQVFKELESLAQSYHNIERINLAELVVVVQTNPLALTVALHSGEPITVRPATGSRDVRVMVDQSTTLTQALPGAGNPTTSKEIQMLVVQTKGRGEAVLENNDGSVNIRTVNQVEPPWVPVPGMHAAIFAADNTEANEQRLLNAMAQQANALSYTPKKAPVITPAIMKLVVRTLVSVNLSPSDISWTPQLLASCTVQSAGIGQTQVTAVCPQTREVLQTLHTARTEDQAEQIQALSQTETSTGNFTPDMLDANATGADDGWLARTVMVSTLAAMAEGDGHMASGNNAAAVIRAILALIELGHDDIATQLTGNAINVVTDAIGRGRPMTTTSTEPPQDVVNAFGAVLGGAFIRVQPEKDEFVTVAAFKAARKLWQQNAEAILPEVLIVEPNEDNTNDDMPVIPARVEIKTTKYQLTSAVVALNNGQLRSIVRVRIADEDAEMGYDDTGGELVVDNGPAGMTTVAGHTMEVIGSQPGCAQELLTLVEGAKHLRALVYVKVPTDHTVRRTAATALDLEPPAEPEPTPPPPSANEANIHPTVRVAMDARSGNILEALAEAMGYEHSDAESVRETLLAALTDNFNGYGMPRELYKTVELVNAKNYTEAQQDLTTWCAGAQALTRRPVLVTDLKNGSTEVPAAAKAATRTTITEPHRIPIHLVRLPDGAYAAGQSREHHTGTYVSRVTFEGTFEGKSSTGNNTLTYKPANGKNKVVTVGRDSECDVTLRMPPTGDGMEGTAETPTYITELQQLKVTINPNGGVCVKNVGTQTVKAKAAAKAQVLAYWTTTQTAYSNKLTMPPGTSVTFARSHHPSDSITFNAEDSSTKVTMTVQTWRTACKSQRNVIQEEPRPVSSRNVYNNKCWADNNERKAWASDAQWELKNNNALTVPCLRCNENTPMPSKADIASLFKNGQVSTALCGGCKDYCGAQARRNGTACSQGCPRTHLTVEQAAGTNHRSRRPAWLRPENERGLTWDVPKKAMVAAGAGVGWAAAGAALAAGMAAPAAAPAGGVVAGMMAPVAAPAVATPPAAPALGVGAATAAIAQTAQATQKTQETEMQVAQVANNSASSSSSEGTGTDMIDAEQHPNNQ